MSVTSSRELPSVAVVVAALDAEATLGACLDSLRALRYPRGRFEVVVVDNGSRDRTREVASSRSVRVVEERRRGPAAARNTGVRATSSDVVALTDADCTVDAGWLEALVAPLAAPAVGLSGGTIRALPPASWIERHGEVVHDHRRAIEHARPPYVVTMNWAARREVIDEIGPFAEDLLRSSDVDYSYRVGAAGHRLAFAPDAIVYHRNESSLLGLAHEGYTHGYHGVAVRRRHEAYVVAALRAADAANAVGAAARGSRLCDTVFRLGKRFGDAAARLRGAG